MITVKNIKILACIVCSLAFLPNNITHASALIDAVIIGDLDRVQETLKSSVDINAQDDGGRTALIWAVRIGRINIIQLLLKYNPDLNIRDKKGWTALIWSLTKKNKEIVELLLEYKPNLNMQYNNGNTALTLAVLNNAKEIVKLLLEYKPDLNIQDVDGSTALIIAASKNNNEMTKLLLKHKPDLNIQDVIGQTALIIATRKNNKEMMNLLLEHNPNINIQGKAGWTALMWSVENHNKEGVELLLAHGANINIQNVAGITALLLAAYNNNTKMVKLLLAHKPNLNIQDNEGRTALMIAAMNNQKEIVDPLFAESQFTIPQKSCFLSFQQEDWNGAIANSLMYAILTKVLVISSSTLLEQLFSHHPFIIEYFNTGRFTVLTNELKGVVVIIPESLANLNLTIPESLKQTELISESALEDVGTIERKYGFQVLHLINPPFVTKVIKEQAAKDRETSVFIDHFPYIIDTANTNHPTRFYLHGHGAAETSIASIPINLLNNFLNSLSAIGTEFLYINSCYTGGTNLLKMQSDLREIITKQIAEQPQHMQNYAIVIQATSGVPTAGTGNINAMFTTLDEFLKDPSWALEFAREEDKPIATITDVIASLGFKISPALPSIRLPGKTGFFRSIDIGNMEIITISKLTEARVTKILELITQSNSKDETIAGEAKMKLEEPLAIKIPIKPDNKFIQIFPIDLTDFIVEITGTLMPNFISKLTGTGQHFIGEITAKLPLDVVIDQGFVNIFGVSAKAEKSRCWFIKSVDLTTAGTIKHFKKLVIKLDPAPAEAKKAYIGSYAYINEKGEYIISKAGDSESMIDKETYESIIRSWFEETIPSQETLTEATGGVEITAEEKTRLIKEKGGAEARRLLEPRFARTPQDLFTIFMTN